jgi:hypothetical protein
MCLDPESSDFINGLIINGFTVQCHYWEEVGDGAELE